MEKNVCLKTIFFCLVISGAPVSAGAQASQTGGTRTIEFPDIPGYLTLKCDFHMHTVFSDGYVWPNIRVQEAVSEGLDAIAITDHIEIQPKSKDVPNPDRNRSYELASQAARGLDLIVINGVEITRQMPPGHANAIFLKNANKLDVDNAMEAYEEAKRQGAFIFWNHPHWTSQRPDGVATLTDMHMDMISRGLLNGIEVFNENTYSDEALDIALSHNLTIIGNSDIHGLVEPQFGLSRGGHRPVTLVFAEKKSEKGIKEALMQGRTVIWFDNTLVGRNEFLLPLITSSLEFTRVGETPVQTLLIENHSDATFIFENLSEYTLHNHPSIFTVGSHEATILQVKTLEVMHPFRLRFRVLNAYTAPNQHPEISIRVQ